MPELPEIIAHAERLDTSHRGAVLTDFEPLAFTVLKTVTPGPDAAVGAPLAGVRHRGKHLLLDFGEVTYVVHLMQAGRLRVDRGARRPRGGLARWWFADPHPSLLLTEAGTERKAGVWVVAGDPDAQPPLDVLGPDADALDADTLDADTLDADTLDADTLGADTLDAQPPLDALGPDADALDADQLATRLAATSGRVHTVLRDQTVLAGIGRRLANEVCHRARLSPFTPVGNLDPEQLEGLAAAIHAQIAADLAHERTLEEMSRAADRPGAVHGRSGEPCPACGDVIREVAYRDYTIHYCPACQTGGKVLADNTTSKFLK